MANSETTLISRKKVERLLARLKYFPDAYSICPTCENVFTEEYEACNCMRFDYE